MFSFVMEDMNRKGAKTQGNKIVPLILLVE